MQLFWTHGIPAGNVPWVEWRAQHLNHLMDHHRTWVPPSPVIGCICIRWFRFSLSLFPLCPIGIIAETLMGWIGINNNNPARDRCSGNGICPYFLMGREEFLFWHDSPARLHVGIFLKVDHSITRWTPVSERPCGLTVPWVMAELPLLYPPPRLTPPPSSACAEQAWNPGGMFTVSFPRYLGTIWQGSWSTWARKLCPHPCSLPFMLHFPAVKLTPV